MGPSDWFLERRCERNAEAGNQPIMQENHRPNERYQALLLTEDPTSLLILQDLERFFNIVSSRDLDRVLALPRI